MSISHLNNKKNIHFKAKWNEQTALKINKCDVAKKTLKLKQKYGIEADFKENKTIAWCCYKVVKIFAKLNQQYKLNIALPRAIYVEDFSKLNTTALIDKNAYGFCNMYPARLLENSEKIYPERTIFFNSFNRKHSIFPANQQALYKWKNIDFIAESLFKSNLLPSNHFLNIFIHEFCHSAHVAQLMKAFKVKNSKGFVRENNAQKLLEHLEKQYSQEYSDIYRKKFSHLMINLCTYASSNPLESIACDLSKRIDKVLDITKFYPTKNPLKHTFYSNKPLYLLRKIFSKKPKDYILQNLLKKIWNGKNLQKFCKTLKPSI